MSENKPVVVLSDEQCRTFLSERRFGRLAMVLAGEPEIVPVNYVWHAGDGHGRLYIRSAPGDKLYAAAANLPVAFEVDEVTDGVGATSVIAHGIARIVEHQDEKKLVDTLDLHPWVTTWKASTIAIDLRKITGRSFDFTARRQGPPTEPA